MTEQELKNRTKKFGIDIIRFCLQLPNHFIYKIIANQLIRSATSIGANYRSACRAKSRADFINKISIVEEEADESTFWLEIIKAMSKTDSLNKTIDYLLNESNQITAIMVASKKTSKSKV